MGEEQRMLRESSVALVVRRKKYLGREKEVLGNRKMGTLAREDEGSLN